MIFVSSSCVRNDSIKEAVELLAKNDFKHIELSGGTRYYNGYMEDLIELKDKYGLTYRCHNYFPPPQEPFVLNLASLNDDIHTKSFTHLAEAITVSKILGADKYSFHAGFFIDITPAEIGKKISEFALFDKDDSIERFCSSFKELTAIADGMTLYVENNVLSASNFQTYKGKNPFMLTHFDEYQKLSEKISFSLLFDVAHLKVSCQVLNLDFKEHFRNMSYISDYWHISDNDGNHDLNHGVSENAELTELIKEYYHEGVDFTLEIYDSLDTIKSTKETLNRITL